MVHEDARVQWIPSARDGGGYSTGWGAPMNKERDRPRRGASADRIYFRTGRLTLNVQRRRKRTCIYASAYCSQRDIQSPRLGMRVLMLVSSMNFARVRT